MAKQPIRKVASLTEQEQADFYTVLTVWHEQATIAAAAAAREQEIRIALVAKFFAGATEGTVTMEIGHGKQLKADIRINRSIDATQYDGLKSFVDGFIDDGSDPNKARRVRHLQGLIDNVVSLKPQVVIGAYKELDPSDKLLLADVITEKVGTPSLKIHTPAT